MAFEKTAMLILENEDVQVAFEQDSYEQDGAEYDLVRVTLQYGNGIMQFENDKSFVLTKEQVGYLIDFLKRTYKLMDK